MRGILVKSDSIIFTSGRTVIVPGGRVGIGPDLVLCVGGRPPKIRDTIGELDPEDRRDLADHMIERWTRFRDRAVAEIG